MNNEPIWLKDIWQIENIAEYKVHFAKWDQREQPLDVWVRSRSAWKGWQEYRPGNNAFNREYIFSLMDFYREEDIWLFGGVFRVTARHDDRYEVKLTCHGEKFIGRLKLQSSYRKRSTRVKFENHYDDFQVQELLRESYSGQAFPGYANIDLSFNELEGIVKNQRIDWKSPLENIKGIYMITDTQTGKRYVGSAYSDGGVWSRWCQYAATGHGGNKQLVQVLRKNKKQYCRDNFRFFLLEDHPMDILPKDITKREEFWKEILLTKGKHGYNS